VLLDVGGQDATEAFEDVGHSDEAREILDGLLIGTLKREVRRISLNDGVTTNLGHSPEIQHPRPQSHHLPQHRLLALPGLELVSMLSSFLAELLLSPPISTPRLKRAIEC
jgi:hypothetical protein